MPSGRNAFESEDNRIRMSPPKLKYYRESKPNTGGPINAKETYLKIHTCTYNQQKGCLSEAGRGRSKSQQKSMEREFVGFRPS